MTQNEDKKTPVRAQSDHWLDKDVYKKNIEFWDRAWNMVKSPYKQLPDLPYLTKIPHYLKSRNVSNVLDLGCGSGWLSVYLCREGFKVTGIDVAPHALELGRMWAGEDGLDIKFDVGDIATLPYAKGSFDAVVANSIFEHLPKDVAVTTLDTVTSLVRPGGSFVGCFDLVGVGAGEYYKLDDGTQVYTDKGRAGMMLHYFPDDELKAMLSAWTIDVFEKYDSGSRFVCAHL